MDSKQFLKTVLQDVKSELRTEFVSNFERKAFFNKPWSPSKTKNGRGSMLLRSGNLRKSIQGRVTSSGVSFSSSLPYASIHNEGGEITVTTKMKRFFWVMHRKASGAIGKGSTKRNQALNEEAQMWKNLALMKPGKKMKIEQRQFIGNHPKVKVIIDEIVGDNLKKLEKEIANEIKKKL